MLCDQCSNPLLKGIHTCGKDEMKLPAQATFNKPRADPSLHSQIRDVVAGAIEAVLLSNYPANTRRVTDAHFIITVPMRGVEYRVRIEVKKC